jgi:RNA recognition motif-containing protein
MQSRIFVGNLSYTATEEDLQKLFEQAGTVNNVTLVKDRDTGRSKGFGFVEMATPDEAQKAITQFHGKDLLGRALTANIARPREERPRGGPFRTGGNNRGGGRDHGHGHGHGPGGGGRGRGPRGHGGDDR